MSIYSGSVDDNDPAVIYSSNAWVLITSDPPWTGTMHSTSILGAYAKFRFTGMYVRYKPTNLKRALIPVVRISSCHNMHHSDWGFSRSHKGDGQY
jgi:hypothetical protein